MKAPVDRPARIELVTPGRKRLVRIASRLLPEWTARQAEALLLRPPRKRGRAADVLDAWGRRRVVDVAGAALASWHIGALDAPRVILFSFLASGALAGLAGGVEVAGLTYALYEGLSPGWGYTAIAVALLGGLHPVAVLGTGVLFGALEAGAGAMQRDAGIPAVWVTAVEALIILAVLALDQVRRLGAAHATTPSDGTAPPEGTGV